jgi:MoaA/NifB/PqqE/SkfB family radical SAM enzyme
MRTGEILASWGKVLRGKTPLLSIEITRECPLKCPGCYAYGDDHLGGLINLRDVSDSRGDDLVQGIVNLVDRHQPLQVSLVGGEPLMRHRELSKVLPILSARGVFTMVVSSGVIPIPKEWTELPRVTVAISVDGLPEHHDIRRAPATYERILKNISGRRVYIHWTVVRSHVTEPEYLDRYLDFWSERQEVHRVWMSVYTPQRKEQSAEMLSPEDRQRLADAIPKLAKKYPKFLTSAGMAEALMRPPSDPGSCAFARISANYTADLQTTVEPCVFGGDPDCSQCGCAISSALHWITNVKLGPVSARPFFDATVAIGSAVQRIQAPAIPRRRPVSSEPSSLPEL